MDRLGGLIHRLPVTSACCPGRCCRHLGPAAAQRLRLRMAAVPGDPGRARPADGLPALPGAGRRRLDGAGGGAGRRLLRARLRHRLPRPAAQRRRARRRTRSTGSAWPRWSPPPRLCVLIGIFPGPVIDLAGSVVAELNAGVTLPAQGGQGWLSLVPIAPDAQLLQRPRSSSCSSPSRASWWPPSSTASARERCAAAPAWDCGYPDAEPAHAVLRRQLRAAAAAGLRRGRVPRPRARSTCRGRARPGRRASRCAGATSSGSGSTRRWPALVDLIADRLDRLQYLTVRDYLTMMFGALVFLLSVVALWR